MSRDLDLATAEASRDETLAAARVALAEGRTDDAFTRYRLALERNNDDLDALLGLAVCHARRKEWEAALAPLNSLCERVPEFAVARAYRGVALFELGAIDQGRADLDAAVDTNPDDVVARVKRAEIELRLGLLPAAEADLRAAARRTAPDDTMREYTRSLLGAVHRQSQHAITRTPFSPVVVARNLASLIGLGSK